MFSGIKIYHCHVLDIFIRSILAESKRAQRQRYYKDGRYDRTASLKAFEMCTKIKVKNIKNSLFLVKIPLNFMIITFF